MQNLLQANLFTNDVFDWRIDEIFNMDDNGSENQIL